MNGYRDIQSAHEYLMTDAHMLFFVLSRHGRVLDVNDFARSMTGCEPGTTRFQDLVVDFSGMFHLREMLPAATQPRLLNIALSCGRPQSFHFHFKPVENRILCFGRLDMTEIQAIQEQVLSLNRDLNVMNRRLQKKNAQLQQLNTEKNQFLGMAAHDLRKPIGLIMAYTEFLQDQAIPVLNSEQQSFLARIQASARFMKTLVDDFLDISAIEAGRFNLNLSPAGLSQVLDDSLAVNRIQARKKGIHLEVDLPSYPGRVMMDGPKIEQAITNLVANAIDHSQPGQSVMIGFSCDGKEVTFQVRDDGPGIGPSEQACLFTPFSRTITGKTGGEKSTGLGMAITRKIITAHQGTLRVDSAPGKGTAIFFHFPAMLDTRNENR